MISRIKIAVLGFGLFIGSMVQSQDLPLFSQKLTNSFLYNPSVAGNGKGSITLSNRTFWNGVPGAPKTQFLSLHSPFAMNKMGAGVNLINEKIGIYDNLYLSGAFAYHLNFNENTALSFGVSSEFTSLKLDLSRIDVLDESDPLLTNDGARTSIDFSFGTSFKTPYFEVGLSSNRLATAFEIADFETQITQFYTGYVSGRLPISETHVFEPYFVYRKLTNENSQWDIGGYYSYNNTVILGAAYRDGGILSPALALRFFDKYMVGYSFEMFGAGLQKNIGNTHEITLRLDFRDDSYAQNTRNSGAIMRSSVAFRRKTMSPNTFRSKPISASSQKYKKKLKRNYMKSPSYRMNSSKKLNTKKYNPNTRKRKKSKFSFQQLFQRKGKSTNLKKSRKANYKKYKGRSNTKRRRK